MTFQTWETPKNEVSTKDFNLLKLFSPEILEIALDEVSGEAGVEFIYNYFTDQQIEELCWRNGRFYIEGWEDEENKTEGWDLKKAGSWNKLFSSSDPGEVILAALEAAVDGLSLGWLLHDLTEMGATPKFRRGAK